jgi:hypothetical protein
MKVRMKRQEEVTQALLRQHYAGTQIHVAGSEMLKQQADEMAQQGATPNQQTTINQASIPHGGTTLGAS